MAGSSAGVDSVGLGCTASSTPASDVLQIRPLKMLWLLKVMYSFITHLNLCRHIAKQYGSLWPGRLAFSANTEGLQHKPGSSVVASGGNSDKVDGGWGLAGTSSSGCILGQGVQYSPQGPWISPRKPQKRHESCGLASQVTHIGDGN